MSASRTEDAPIPTWIDGPDDADWTIVLAHGAGAPADHPFMEGLATRLAAHGLRIVRFEFAYMARRRTEGVKPGPDRPPKLDARFREVIAAAQAPGRLCVAGKSMGARSAGRMAAEVGADAMVAVGFPFHPPGRPERTRLDDLPQVVPALIVQGERDPFGRADEVAAYRLPATVTVHTLPDGDHGLKPRKASGHTLDEHLDAAADRIAAFLRAL